MIKIIVIVAFLLIIFNLGLALFHLLNSKDAAHSQKTAKALTYRIGLSLALFLALAAALSLGLIKPQGIGANIQHYRAQAIPTKP